MITLRNLTLCIGNTTKSFMMSGQTISRYKLGTQGNIRFTLSPTTRSFWKNSANSEFGNYSVITEPLVASNYLSVPDHIVKPEYAETGKPLPGPKFPEIKNEGQIQGMRKACQMARMTLNEVSKYLKVGVTTAEIDLVVHNKAIESGSYPSTLNYRGFPRSCCTSVNNVACHGIPDGRPLEDGDVVSVDVTVFHDGFHGDCCETFLVGNVDERGRHLVEAALRSRDEAISICGPGVPFAHIGAQVEGVAKEEGLSVVPAFTGHGIGRYFHGSPDIYHCFNDYPGEMKPGMTFTVEPVVSQGSREVMLLEDGWTALMVDGGRAAQFEHTILITQHGHEILTCYY